MEFINLLEDFRHAVVEYGACGGAFGTTQQFKDAVEALQKAYDGHYWEGYCKGKEAAYGESK